MDPTKLAAIVGLLISLSVASERLVEIIKGVIPFLKDENSDSYREGVRRSMLQLLAVAAGIATALLAQPVILQVVELPGSSLLWILALGLLASGGSGFWNSVLTYVLKIKDLKTQEAEDRKLEVEKKKRAAVRPG